MNYLVKILKLLIFISDSFAAKIMPFQCKDKKQFCYFILILLFMRVLMKLQFYVLLSKIFLRPLCFFNYYSVRVYYSNLSHVK